MKVGLSDHTSPGQSDIEGDHRGWGLLAKFSLILDNTEKNMEAQNLRTS